MQFGGLPGLELSPRPILIPSHSFFDRAAGAGHLFEVRTCSSSSASSAGLPELTTNTASATWAGRSKWTQKLAQRRRLSASDAALVIAEMINNPIMLSEV